MNRSATDGGGRWVFKDGLRHAIWFWSFDFMVNKSSLVSIFLSSYDCSSGEAGYFAANSQLSLTVDFVRLCESELNNYRGCK